MISLLVVNYRSAPLALEAICSARAATRDPLQVVVVDNSVDSTEADRLRNSADILITPSENLGYAGGINAGRPHCRGEVIVISNPDVVFAPASLDELVHALAQPGVAVAGPALYWDDAHAWILPPSELHTAREALDRALASRMRWWAHLRDRRRIAARVRFWSLTQPTEMRALSGAVMAVRASDFDLVGGFDERFQLYFEENDFLRRVADRGKRIVYVPAARCRHLYNQSAGADSDRAAAVYAESELRYLSKWHGAEVARIVKALERPWKTIDAARAVGPVTLSDRDLLVEASPLSSFDTAAGHFPHQPSVDVPPEVLASYRSGVLYLRAIDRRSLRVITRWARYRS
jgi:N-acetylglucosaminyl-diphospho-decaprenol L-rhamnosyltransferase